MKDMKPTHPKSWPLEILQLLQKIGSGGVLTKDERAIFHQYISTSKKKLFRGWCGNGLMRACDIIRGERERMSIESISTGKSDKTAKTQVKLPATPKPKIIKPKSKVKLS